MKSIKNCRLGILLGGCLALTSCVEDTLHNTSHPEQGAVKITTDWSACSSESVLPSGYTLRIGEAIEQKVTGPANAYSFLLPAGTYDLLAYNSPSGFFINENTAVVSVNSDGYLHPRPGYLFSASEKVHVIQDDSIIEPIQMQQRVRQVVFVLNLKDGEKDNVESVTATLSGIASGVDLRTGALLVTGREKLPSSFQASKELGLSCLVDSIVTLGPDPNPKVSQELLINVETKDGRYYSVKKNLTSQMEGFSQSVEPLRIDADLVQEAEP